MEGTPHAERRKAAEVTSHRRVAECNTKKKTNIKSMEESSEKHKRKGTKEIAS